MALSIKDLYAYALAEGEGVGTAYEYFVKRRLIAPLLRGLGSRPRLLVAGLPEKYGTSLDFVVCASELGADILLVDDRPAAIARARGAIDEASRSGTLHGACAELRRVDDLMDLGSLAPRDLALSCEVLQRLSRGDQKRYVETLLAVAPRGVVFAPNSENASHLAISGLAGIDRRTLAALFDGRAAQIGFVDLPPFPPGIKRSEEQRARASSGTMEAVAMRGLEMYSAAEPLLPALLKRRFAHITYATWTSSRAASG